MGHSKYRHNYRRLYPDVDISPDILDALKESDHKMEYMEMDLKLERTKKGGNDSNPILLPPREDSLERLLSNNHIFIESGITPDEYLMQKAEIGTLHQCLAQLNSDEYSLIQNIFYYGLSEQDCAKIIGITQQAVHKRKKVILAKLRNLYEL